MPYNLITKISSTDNILNRSFFKGIFTKYGYKQYHRMFSWLFTLVYGYFLSQVIKTSGYLDQSSYYNQSAAGFVYDMLNMLAYSVCLYHMSGLQKNRNSFYNIDSLLYWIPYLSSIIGFAALGEISWLRTLAITWGFWERLTNKAVNFLLISSGLLISFIIYQIKRACYENRIRQLICPLFIIGFVYSLSWVILSQIENASSILHLHHAFLAAIFSFWFSNWDNVSAIIWHAINIGIWAEGWNIYGTEEVYIFMDSKNGTNLSLLGSVSIIMFLSIFLISGLRFTTIHKNPSIKRSVSFPGVEHTTIEIN